MSIADERLAEAPMDPEEAARQRRQRRDRIGRWLVPLVVGALAIWGWDRIVVVNEIPHYILPRPGLVAKTLWIDWATLAPSPPADSLSGAAATDEAALSGTAASLDSRARPAAAPRP